MIDRVIEISNPARLCVRDAQLVIQRDSSEDVRTPVSEVGVLLISHPQVVLTQAVLSRIAVNGGVVITCDDSFLPASMLLPLNAHFLQGERFAGQIALTDPRRKRLWQRIVRAKILMQACLLKELHGTDGGLGAMSSRVRSGDTENLEAQAARRYWPLLFADSKFRRGGMGPDQNRHLDYGYTVLRAATARSLCAAGLHPSIGIRHHNRYDTFSLASDLMEPFRPVVDRLVFQWIQEHDPAAPLDSAAKHSLLQMLVARYHVDGEERTLSDVLGRTAQGLAMAVCGEKECFRPPEELRLCAEQVCRHTVPCGS